MLEDWSGRKTFAEYASFRIEAEADFYKLRVGRYHGNAGDSLTWHNGKQFTTLDRDHDVYTGEKGITPFGDGCYYSEKVYQTVIHGYTITNSMTVCHT